MKNQKSVFQYFLSLYLREKKLLSIVLISVSIGISFLRVFRLWPLKDIFDFFAENPDRMENIDQLWTSLFWFLGLWVFAEIFFRFLDFNLPKFRSRVGKHAIDFCFTELMKQETQFFAGEFVGSLVNKVKKFTGGLYRFIDVFLMNYIEPFLMFVVGSIVVSIYSPLVAIAIVIGIFIFIIVMYPLVKWKMKYNILMAHAHTRVAGEAADSITNVFNINIFSSFHREISRFSDVTSFQCDKVYEEGTVHAKFNTVKILLMLIIFGGIFILLFWQWEIGAISTGVVAFVMSYLLAILGNIWMLTHGISDTMQILADAQEMTDILNRKTLVKDTQNPEKSRISDGSIEWKKVDYRYEDEGPGNSISVFSQLSLSIKPGEKVGIVGHSGGGKTTFTKLLLRLMDIQGGEVLIDGQNIAHITKDDLRRNIAYIPQDPMLFHRTLRENIAYGNPDATDSEIEKVSKKAHAHDFIKELPQQYETKVGERGIKLSGGQRQRVAIARAMLKKCPILIMDEATSSLDSESENFIQESLDNIMKNRTTIIVAHRLSTIQKMDRIIVLDKGKIIEQGSHAELLQKSGAYKKLWSAQVGGFLVE